MLVILFTQLSRSLSKLQMSLLERDLLLGGQRKRYPEAESQR